MRGRASIVFSLRNIPNYVPLRLVMKLYRNLYMGHGQYSY